VARLCREHGIEALVAFRSHIAFEMARTRRPDVIVATACHDRLLKALRNVPDIPALLAPLPAMGRPCRDAGVDLDWLQQQLVLLAPKSATARAGASGGPSANTATLEAEQS
jgi:Flp pilus assembly CpaE family ATPase